MVILGWFVLLAVIATASNSAKAHVMRDKLLGHLRAIAQEPVPDPKDPRLKNWNPDERFPRPTLDQLLRT